MARNVSSIVILKFLLVLIVTVALIIAGVVVGLQFFAPARDRIINEDDSESIEFESSSSIAGFQENQNTSDLAEFSSTTSSSVDTNQKQIFSEDDDNTYVYEYETEDNEEQFETSERLIIDDFINNRGNFENFGEAYRL